MAEDHLQSDEDIEEILKLAMEKSSVTGDLLRQRLKSTAQELGISEEQLQVAEEEYRLKKERQASLEIEEARLAKQAKQNRVHYWRTVGRRIAFMALIAITVLFVFPPQSLHPTWLLPISFILIVVLARRSRRSWPARPLDESSDRLS